MEQPELPGMPGPDVVEITLRVGFVTSSQHGQWQLEVRNPVSGELLAMFSRPHFDMSNLGPEAARMVLRVSEAMRAAVGADGSGATDSRPVRDAGADAASPPSPPR